MSKLITITSGKGGVGKTTTSINLATALNSLGKDVIIVDANLTTPNVGLHLGAPIVPISLNHVLLGKAKIEDAIYEHESGTKIIPSSLSINELRRINHKRLKEVGKRLRKMADVVIFDSAAGLGEEAIAAMDSADELIIVTNPEIPAVTDALKTSKLIEQLGKPVKGVVINRFDPKSKTQMPLKNVSEMLELPILGVIPEDLRVQQSLVMKDALVHTFPKSKPSIAFKKIAAKLEGIDYNPKVSFFDKLFGKY
jgi:septum site-determining protein MinD